MEPTKFADLPEDILFLVFPYLLPRDFLALCSVNKTFHETYRLDSTYWRDKTSKTFRLPIHPLLRADGNRWHWLYKKLRTQTKAYTWGQNSSHCLGHDQVYDPSHRGPRAAAHHSCHWPTKMNLPEFIRIVADLQCGGWSTTLLTSEGILYFAGMINPDKPSRGGLRRLLFPPGYAPVTESRQDPSTAIKHFSSGRSHILGLSDDGKIWSWDGQYGQRVELLNVESDKRAVTRLVAGWDKSSAYIIGTGIVYWEPVSTVLTRGEDQCPETDLFECDDIVVQGTAYRRSDLKEPAPFSESESVGEVLNHIVLEGFIVFITDINKAFASKIGEQGMAELTTFTQSGRQLQDIQGSFRRFGIFTAAGDVLIGDKDLLEAFWRIKQHSEGPTDPLQPSVFPALQHNKVISLAFGDYHMHALHSDGRISSYGNEPQACGALGLGEYQGEGQFRGIRMDRFGFIHDNGMSEHSKTFSHHIWFETEKRKWLSHLKQSAIREAQERPEEGGMATVQASRHTRDRFSEWVEQEGLAWDDFPDIKAQNEDHLGAYFALSVAAAGWHSGALVLVDRELEEKVAKKHIVEEEASSGLRPPRYRWDDQPFPRIKLYDDYEMPGEVELSPWKYGMPPGTKPTGEA